MVRISINKNGIVFILSLLLTVTGFSQSLEPIETDSLKRNFRIEIKISGGLNYLSIGDWNTYMESETRLNQDMASLFNYSIGGRFKKIHSGLNFEGDFIVYLTPRFGISIGSGYISGKKGNDSNKIFTHHQLFTETAIHDTNVRAIPIKLGVYYILLLFNRANIYLNGGIGYYFAQWSDDYRREWNGYWEVIKQSASGMGFGFHGGVGLDYNFNQNLSFVLECNGRYTKIGSFKGEYDYRNSGDWTNYYEGTLFYYELDLSWMGLDWYPKVKVLNQVPSPPQFRNIRKAKVDFSGFSVRTGIKIKF